MSERKAVPAETDSPSKVELAARAFASALDQGSQAQMARTFNAYDAVQARLQEDIDKLTEKLAGLGRKPSPHELFQLERYQELQQQARSLIAIYGAKAFDNIQAAQLASIQSGVRAAPIIAGAAGLSPGEGTSFATVPQGAVINLLGQLNEGSPLEQLLKKDLADEAVTAVDTALIQGMGAGLGPVVVGRMIAEATRYPAYRAARIARTEMLRAANEGIRAAYQRMGNVKAWRWSAALSARTCPACLALSGKVFPLDRPMWRHVQCRCTMIPVLGGGRDVIPQTGEEWLAGQTPAVQAQVLGKAGALGYAEGAFGLDDFLGVRPSSIWGNAYKVNNLAQVNGRARAAGRGYDAGGYEDMRVRAAGKSAPATPDQPVQIIPPGTPQKASLSLPPQIAAPKLRNAAEAVDWFTNTAGLTIGEMGGNTTVWNKLAEVYADRISQGLLIEKNLQFVASKGTGVLAIKAAYDSKTGEITRRWLEVNTGKKVPWAKIEETLKHQHEIGYLVGDSLADVFTHEMGHKEHLSNIKKDVYGTGYTTSKGLHVESGTGWRFSEQEEAYGPEWKKRAEVAGKVSKYAKEGGAVEFVAEVYTGLEKGITYPPDVMELFTDLGGVKPER